MKITGGLSQKTIALMLILIFNLILTTGCSTAVSGNPAEKADENTIRIGVYEPLSGSDEAAAAPEVLGIQLAHERYPSVMGKKVELVYSDNRSDVDYAHYAAKELINQGVTLVLGSYGNTLCLAAGDLFREAGIPAIAITCTNPLVTIGNPYYFRVAAVDTFQGIMAAKYVYNNSEEVRAAVMKKKGDDYGAALSQSFTDKLISLAGDEKAVVSAVEYNQAEDVKSQLSTIKASGATVVFLTAGAEDAVLITKQAKKIGLGVQFLGTDLWKTESLIQAGGTAVEGLIFSSLNEVETDESQESEEFYALYQAAYGESDNTIHSVALGFDAYLLALDALEKQMTGESTGDEFGAKPLHGVLAGTSQFPGVSGSLTFDQNGDPIKPVVFMTVKNGEFIYLTTIEPEWGQ